MATIIYPRENTAIRDFMSGVNTMVGLGGLLQRKRQDDLRMGKNVDDIEFQNTNKSAIDKLIDSNLKRYGPEPELSGAQKILATYSPEERAKMAQYREIQGYLDQNKIQDAEKDFLDINAGELSLRDIKKQGDILDRAIHLKDVERAQMLGTDPNKIKQYRENRMAKVDANTGNIQYGNFKQSDGGLRRVDLENDEAYRKADIQNYRKNRYDKNVQRWNDLKKLNVESFTGNADDVLSANQDLHNELIQYNLEEYDRTGNKKYLNEATKWYNNFTTKERNMTSTFGWNPVSRPSAMQFNDYYKKRFSGGSTRRGNTIPVQVPGINGTFYVTKGLETPQMADQIYNQINEMDPEKLGGMKKGEFKKWILKKGKITTGNKDVYKNEKDADIVDSVRNEEDMKTQEDIDEYFDEQDDLISSYDAERKRLAEKGIKEHRANGRAYLYKDHPFADDKILLYNQKNKTFQLRDRSIFDIE